VTRFSFHDIYEWDHKLTGYRVPPEGINQLKSLNYPGKPVEFEIRDANYYPQFATSARMITPLAEQAGIGTIDLLVGINTHLLEDILRITGPITLEGVPIPLDHTNAGLILSLLVEAKKSLQ